MSGSVSKTSILDDILVGKILRRIDGGVEVLCCQGGRQVGRVGGDQDQSEEPPDAAHNAGGGGPGVEV